MKKFLLLAWCATLLPACSAYMAYNQPEKKDVGVLSNGTSRMVVMAELGQPVGTIVKDGKRTDIFHFHKGSDGGWKAGRAAFHAIADVFTIGLWEIVGMPIEGVAKGDKVRVMVLYDADDTIETVTYRSGGDESDQVSAEGAIEY